MDKDFKSSVKMEVCEIIRDNKFRNQLKFDTSFFSSSEVCGRRRKSFKRNMYSVKTQITAESKRTKRTHINAYIRVHP